MPFPLYPDKVNHIPLHRARQLIEQKLPPSQLATPPTRLILLPQKSTYQYLKHRYGGRQLKSFLGRHLRLRPPYDHIVIASGFGVGGPAVAAIIHEYAAWGIESCVLIGIAGGLQSSLNVGDTVICHTALRDEGVSQHYLAPNIAATAAQGLVSGATKQLNNQEFSYRLGTSWTTDTPFHITNEEIEQQVTNKTLTLEMEAASVYAICLALQIDALCMFTISDLVSLDQWSIQHSPKKIQATLETLATLAVTL